jgi:hypothetical protein
MLLEAEGPVIQLLISVGKTTVTPRCAMAIRTPTVWNDDKDELLLNLVAENEGKWKLMSRRSKDVTEVECKSRWMFLSNQRRLR